MTKSQNLQTQKLLTILTAMHIRSLKTTSAILIVLCWLPMTVFGSGGDYYKDLTFASAQCQAECYRQFHDNKEAREKCIQSCGKVPKYCEDECNKEDTSCLAGCTILSQVLRRHSGSCPTSGSRNSDGDTILRQPSCLGKCKTDQDCFSTLNKCCPVGCSLLCVKPHYNNSVPVLAPRLEPAQNSSDLEFEWMASYQSFIDKQEPLTFILQTRVCPCKVFDVAYTDKWQTLIITTQMGARLNAFDAGKLYQFRLAAVSRYGTRGYGEASRTFPQRVLRPSAPFPPRQVRELLTRIHSSGDIGVTIGWEKPPEHALPVSEYVVKWMIDYGYVQSDGQALSALTQFTQPIPPDRQSYVLENLKPNTSYRVELYTKIYWPGDEPIVSQPTSFFIVTPSVYQSKLPDLQHITPEKCKENVTISLNNVEFATISAPIYGQDGLKVSVKILTQNSNTYNIRWTPKICIDFNDNQLREGQKTQHIQTKSKLVQLTNLHFNCRYHIAIEPSISGPRVPADSTLDRGGDRIEPSSEAHFCVPSCSSLNGARCDEQYPLSNPPPQPLHLSSAPIKDDNLLSYEVRWLPPSLLHLQDREGDLSRRYSVRYRIVWGPRLSEPVKFRFYRTVPAIVPLLDSSRTYVKVLNKNQNRLLLRNLIPETLYVIKVQLLVTSRDGQEMESDVVQHFLFTGNEAAASQMFDNVQNNAKNVVCCHPLTMMLLLLIVGVLLSE